MKLDRTTLQLLIVTIAILALLVIINYEGGNRVKDVPPQVPVINDIVESENALDSNLTVYVSGNVCEGCHLSDKPFIPQAMTLKAHAGGGAYCLSCHKISHEKHPVNDNVTCEKCHGTTPGMPVFTDGSISCNNCHGYPDPLLPSYGNLMTIHRERGIACTKCHNDECSKCHVQIGADQRWEKRMTHFRTIVRTK